MGTCKQQQALDRVKEELGLDRGPSLTHKPVLALQTCMLPVLHYNVMKPGERREVSLTKSLLPSISRPWQLQGAGQLPRPWFQLFISYLIANHGLLGHFAQTTVCQTKF